MLVVGLAMKRNSEAGAVLDAVPQVSRNRIDRQAPIAGETPQTSAEADNTPHLDPVGMQRDLDTVNGSAVTDRAVKTVTVDTLEQIEQGLASRFDQGTDTPEVGLALARVRIDLSSQHRLEKRSPQALDTLKSATEIATALRSKTGGALDPSQINDLASVYFAISQEHVRLGKFGHARETCETALGLWEQLVAGQPAQSQYRSRLQTCNLALKRIQEQSPQRALQTDRP